MPELWLGRFEDAYRRQLQAWVDATHTGRTSGATAWDGLLATITANAVWRDPPSPSSATTAPDAGDAHLWDLLACEPHAALVTGDQLLLNNPYPGRVLMQPRQLWAQ